MNLLSTLLLKWRSKRAQRRLFRLRSEHERMTLRMEYEFALKKVAIERLYEDGKKKLKRAQEDWALESSFAQDQIDAYADEVLGHKFEQSVRPLVLDTEKFLREVK